MSGKSADILPQALPGTYSTYIKKWANALGVEYPYGGVTTTEFYLDGKAMINARYPNEGYFNDYKTQGAMSTDFYAIYNGAFPRNWESDTPADELVPEEERNILDGFTLQCRGDELIRRAGNWQNANQAILFGFFTYDWASQAVPLKEVVPTVDGKGTLRYNISSKYPCYYGLGGGSVNPSLRFYVYDLFEEIDIQGEYFLDRTPGAEKLYFYSEAAPDPNKSILMVSKSNKLIELNNAKNVTIEGINFTGVNSSAISGTNVDNVKIKNCKISNTSGTAIHMVGKNSVIEDCVIKDVNGGIYIGGGDTVTLDRGNNIVRNNEISNFATITKTYTSAVEMSGVGNTVTQNEIHDNGHLAIQFSGCYNEISYNDIYDVLKDSNDSGAIYTGRSWINRGNEIKYNHIHDCVTNTNLQQRSANSGVYFDDHYSGAYIYGNIFANLSGSVGVHLNGGNGNIVDNNLFVNCKKAVECKDNKNSVQDYIDAGETEESAQAKYAEQFITHDTNLNKFVENVRNAGAESIWQAAFPEFWEKATTDPESFRRYENNEFTDNVIAECEVDYVFEDTTNAPNYSATSSDFIDYTNKDYTLKNSALREFETYTQIDLSKIGIQR